MTQYIDKSTLVAEIEKRRNEFINSLMTEQIHTLSDILDIIDTLEVKEVDLNNKGEWKNTGGFGSTWDPDSPDYYPD